MDGEHATVTSPIASVNWASSGFFEAAGVTLRAGRLFARQDATANVAVLSESLARQLSATGPSGASNALGRAIEVMDSTYTIVGVVGDVKYRAPDQGLAPVVYLPFSSSEGRALPFVVRTFGDPAATVPAIRAAVRAVDADLPVEDLQTLEQVRDSVVAPQRFRVAVLGGFAGLALLLATFGLYAVIAQSVAQRTRELGIRLALGAGRGRVIASVLLEGMLLAGAGVVIGTVVSRGTARVLASVLFGVTPTDGVTYTMVSLALIGVAAAAGLLPARRAASIDPVQALRSE
jgi:ABC-type antimicrobial peptide transport system permease subunit